MTTERPCSQLRRPVVQRAAGASPKPRAQSSSNAPGAHDIPSERARPAYGVPSSVEPCDYPPVQLGQADYTWDWHPDDGGSPESVFLWIFGALVTWAIAIGLGVAIAWIIRGIVQ